MLLGKDDVALRFARWDATRGPRRGTACVFPGRGEPIEKYFEVIADLRRRGFAVAMLDWRGQGGSARLLANPRKGHVASFGDYEADVLRFMKDIVLPDCPPPFIALGHSMGGNVLLRLSVVQGLWFERMVLVAPMLDIARERLPVPTAIAKLFASVAGIGPLGRLYVPGGSDTPVELCPFEGNPFSSDRERFERNRQLVEQRPDLAIGSPTNGWLRAAFASCSRLMAPDMSHRVRIPMLLVAAGTDRIVSSSAIETFASRLKIGARVALAGSQHEILHERDEIRQRFWAAFDAYLGTKSLAA
ncbi:MAG: alpha/beta fold hydrolase [Hyphomicrobiaceae bacterium]